MKNLPFIALKFTYIFVRRLKKNMKLLSVLAIVNFRPNYETLINELKNLMEIFN